MTHEIITEYNIELKFWKLTCTEGHNITAWNEGDDIKEYSAFKTAYCPQDADLTLYHCVSDEEDAKYREEQLKALKEEEEKMRKEMENKQNEETEMSTVTVEE